MSTEKHKETFLHIIKYKECPLGCTHKGNYISTYSKYNFQQPICILLRLSGPCPPKNRERFNKQVLAAYISQYGEESLFEEML